MPNRKDVIIRANEALEHISNGLLLLEQIEGLDDIIGPKMVDVTARLNASYNKLEKYLTPLKDKIKADALSNGLVDGESVIPGQASEAVVTKSFKTMLDGDAVKTWLGRKLPQFLKKVESTQVQFRVRG